MKKMIVSLRRIKYFYLKIIKIILWKINNRHNYLKIKTSNYKTLNLKKIKCGKLSYGVVNVEFYGNDKEFLEIGSFCSIATNVVFLLGGNHTYSNISTYPFNNFIFKEKECSNSKGSIIVKDDVWIGMNSIILSGVTIGQGSIIGAGSVITKDVPPYSIVAGNPAIVRKYRFSKSVINKLLELNLDKLNEIEKSFLYMEIDEKNIDKIVAILNKRS